MIRSQLLIIAFALGGCAQSMDDAQRNRNDHPVTETASILAGQAGTKEVVVSTAHRLGGPELIEKTVKAILHDEAILADHYLLEGYIPIVLLDSDEKFLGAYFVDTSAATDLRPVLRPARASRSDLGFTLQDPYREFLPSEVPAIPAPFLRNRLFGSGG